MIPNAVLNMENPGCRIELLSPRKASLRRWCRRSESGGVYLPSTTDEDPAHFECHVWINILTGFSSVLPLLTDIALLSYTFHLTDSPCFNKVPFPLRHGVQGDADSSSRQVQQAGR